MKYKLTKNLRSVIFRQFKDGATIDYLDKLYEFKTPRVEQLIRLKMIENEGKPAPTAVEVQASLLTAAEAP